MSGILKKLFNYIETENIRGLVRYLLILFPFVSGGIWAVTALISYATAHQEILIILVVAACMIIPVFWGKKPTLSPPNTEVVNSDITFFDNILLRGLYEIFTSYPRQLQIIPPGKFADLRDVIPSKFDNGKSIVVYRFKVVSDGEPLEPALFHEVLTVHLEEKLANKELALGKSTAEFNNQLFPKLYIDECIFAGGVWHISILICDNEKVARYIANKRQTLIMRHSPIALQYEEGDF